MEDVARDRRLNINAVGVYIESHGAVTALAWLVAAEPQMCNHSIRDASVPDPG